MLSCRNWQSRTMSAERQCHILLKGNRVHRLRAMRHSSTCSLDEISSVDSLVVGASGAGPNVKEARWFNKRFTRSIGE